MSTSLPDTLRTQRLILREPRHSDAAGLFNAYTQDPEVARYMTWRPQSQLAETEAFVAYCMKGWAEDRSRAYILARHENEDLPIGMLEARLQPHTIDIGYVLQRKDWKTGLMSEAITAFCDTALALPEYFRIQATCDTENQASARTLEKAGFVREGELKRHMMLPNLDDEPRSSLMYARCR
ncbi:GNAT family N-acetyltransferase [Duganella aceris]|uniref:GNAT family N-acetyltransferase n=1 Tax=Duganella aceris TaxID=2703883 RepID=A0ABX0FJ73_9BURK|nr:GNAT family protein [Duganella aceris]NGZ84640.1 GNAT family N-acetyltransferase [Duganella aceris]